MTQSKANLICSSHISPSIPGLKEEVALGSDSDRGHADPDCRRHDTERYDPGRHDSRGCYTRWSDTWRDDARWSHSLDDDAGHDSLCAVPDADGAEGDGDGHAQPGADGTDDAGAAAGIQVKSCVLILNLYINSNPAIHLAGGSARSTRGTGLCPTRSLTPCSRRATRCCPRRLATSPSARPPGNFLILY